jgi:F0F1-type ATP synthase assembly protein I
MVHSGIVDIVRLVPRISRQECSLSDEKLPKRSEQRDGERDLQKIATASTLGFGVAVSLALLVGGGVWLDQRLDLAPVFTLIGLLLGLIAAGYQLYELTLVGQDDRDNGPLGRTLERRFSRKATPR